MKDANLNFKHTRSEGVKIYFSAYELKQKPIKYWTNVGYEPENSNLRKIIRKLKDIVCDKTANGIEHLSYYEGGRLLFPYHIAWHGDSFEFRIYNPFGDGSNSFKISRKVKSQNERFTQEDVENMKKYMCSEYHLISDTYEMAKKIIGSNKHYSEIRRNLEEIESVYAEHKKSEM